MEEFGAELKVHGLDLMRTPDGRLSIVAVSENEVVEIGSLPPERRQELEGLRGELSEKLEKVTRWGAGRQAELVQSLRELEREVGDAAVGELIDAVMTTFAPYHGLARWLTEMRVDVLDNLALFRADASGDGTGPNLKSPEARYAVNLLVDHGDHKCPSVVLEANPTYENMFGRIEYRQIEGGLETDFTLIRAGSLHRANGGILVMRADAVAGNAPVWEFLKGALRDRQVRVEELQRVGTLPIAGAPRPDPIPLEIKVVIVGSPHWYYTFFSIDPGFRTHFKIKADIDGEMDATADNVALFGGLIRRMARERAKATLEPTAVTRLLGVASRWAAHRGKLTARYELIGDLICEAACRGDGTCATVLGEDDIIATMVKRRRRNARVEDRLHEGITRGVVMIDTQSAVVGQVNALTVRDMGDHAFGTPARVTARASAGRLGVINIERDILLGGPIQQKGVMVLQGFLAGRFARHFPLSFSCSITFEQSYGEVEGDSASIAEFLAVVSDLSGLALRQDLAITGSVNQRGQVQAIGGAHYKVEGFFRTCQEKGLTGGQGVVIPAANEINLVLRDDVVEAVADGSFHIWIIETIDEAIELFTGVAAGTPDDDGVYPPDTVYGRVMAQLQTFDRILAERARI